MTESGNSWDTVYKLTNGLTNHCFFLHFWIIEWDHNNLEIRHGYLPIFERLVTPLSFVVVDNALFSFAITAWISIFEDFKQTTSYLLLLVPFCQKPIGELGINRSFKSSFFRELYTTIFRQLLVSISFNITQLLF